MEKEKSNSVFYDFTGKTVVVSHSVKIKYDERCLSLIFTDLQTQRRLLTVKLSLAQVNETQTEIDRFLQTLRKL